MPDGSIVAHPYQEVLKELAEKESKQLESQELELPKYRVVVDKKIGEVYQRM